MLKGKKTGHTKDAVLLAFSVAVTLWSLIKLDYHTGACFNPAVAIGQTYFQTRHLRNINQWLSHYLYAYTVGPCIGGSAAGFFYLLLKPCHREQDEGVGADNQNQSERSNSKS